MDPVIEAVTTNHVIVGRCAAIFGSIRLVDVLNRDPHVLTLTECKSRTLRESRDLELLESPDSATITMIPKEQIVWARLLKLATDADEQRQAPTQDRIQKKPHPVIVLAPPFQITGNTHIAEAADVNLALTRLVRAFLPLTEARVVFEGGEAALCEDEVIVLNGRLVDAISLRSTDELAGSAHHVTVGAEGSAALLSSAESWSRQRFLISRI